MTGIINGYKLINEIGCGSFGKVFEVTKDSATYALKMTNSKTDKEVELAEKEKQVLERISNEACDFIVKIVRDGLFWCLDDKLCIVMEFSQQGSLRKLIDNQRTGLYSTIVFNWSKDIMSGLKFLHKLDVIHRDIKPENILIFETTEGDLRLKLTDFGLSRIIDSKTLTTKLGTTGYQSPEMQNGQVTNEKTDIWSAGCVIFELTYLKMYYRVENNRENEIYGLEKPTKLIKLIEMMLIKLKENRPSAEVILSKFDSLENINTSEKLKYLNEQNDQKINFASSNIRKRNDKFIGRQEFLNKIDAAFVEKRLVILSGQAGIGKTALALEYGHLFKERNNNYVHMIEKNDDIVLNVNKMEQLIEYLKSLNQEGIKILLIFEIKFDNYNEIKDPIDKLCDSPNVLILITSTDDTLLNIIRTGQLPMYLNSEIISLQPFKNDESINFIKTHLEDIVRKNILRDAELDEFVNIFDFSSNSTLPNTLIQLINIFNSNQIKHSRQKIDEIKSDKNKKILSLISENLLKKNKES